MYELSLRMQKKILQVSANCNFQSLNSTSPVDPLCSLTDNVIAVRKLSNQTSWVRQPQHVFLPNVDNKTTTVQRPNLNFSSFRKNSAEAARPTLDFSHHNRQRHSLQTKRMCSSCLSDSAMFITYHAFRFCNHVIKDVWNINEGALGQNEEPRGVNTTKKDPYYFFIC